MASFESSVVIDRPLEEVFEFMTEEGSAAQWQPWLLESTKTSDGPVGVGTTGREVRKFLGVQIETTGEVTEWEPNRRTSVKSTSGPIPMHSTWTFDAAEDGTRLSTITEVDFGGFYKLAGPAIIRMAKRQLDTDLANLKDLLESQA